MSTLKVTNVQVGQSNTATQNFTLTAAASDGTMKLARGNQGATTQDVLTVDASGNVDHPVGMKVGGMQAYACRAWVMFNGVPATPTIYASGNVSSVTKIGTGVYRVNFTNAMPDTNYCVSGCAQFDEANSNASTPLVGIRRIAGAVSATSVDITTSDVWSVTAAPYDCLRVSVTIFR